MKKSIGKVLAGAIIGAATGYVFMYILKNSQFEVNIPSLSFEMTVVIMAISILLIIFSIYGFARIKSEFKRHVTGDEEDERDARLYKLYSDIMLAASIALYFSTFMLALIAVTDRHNAFIFISLALILISTSLNIIFTGQIKIFYPDRNLPSVNDKQYAQKLLVSSDEGERHVMFQGMYRAYTSLNALLFFAVLVLIAYSVISGVSQLFGVFMIILILVITNAQYMLTIRNK